MTEATRIKITEALRTRRPFYSFEFFPPKTDDGVRSLFETISALRVLEPAFVSVTYGAGGSTRARTVELAKRIKGELGLEVLAHATCVGSTRDELRRLFDDLASGGIENVLALRGDAPKDGAFEPAGDGFRYASELIELLASEYAFCIGAACYPETHPEASGAGADLDNTLRKVRAGAEFLISQLFFQNDTFFAFVERARVLGVAVPILPGIMPITNYQQVARFTAMCGATIPAGLIAELERRRDEPEAVAELGVAYAALQSSDLLARGAAGMHYYTLNRSPATRAVVSAMLAARPEVLLDPA